jgi:hypothetical protein
MHRGVGPDRKCSEHLRLPFKRKLSVRFWYRVKRSRPTDQPEQYNLNQITVNTVHSGALDFSTNHNTVTQSGKSLQASNSESYLICEGLKRVDGHHEQSLPSRTQSD